MIITKTWGFNSPPFFEFIPVRNLLELRIICHTLKTKQMKKIHVYLMLFVIVLFSSCVTQGYGCKGNQSWNKMVRRINNGY